MERQLVTALATALLIPALAVAVPRPREVRPDPKTMPSSPSYVRLVEPAIVGLKVNAAPEAPSSARLGAERFASAVVFDERGYALTVSYAVLDAVKIRASMRDNRTVEVSVVGIDFESGLGVVKLAGPGLWPVATLRDSRDVAVGEVTGTVGVDEDNDLVYVVGGVQAIRRFSAFWEYMLKRAFFVAPSSPSWGGSVVVDARGQVIGIASLRLGEPPHVNLAIPIETFLPVKDEIVAAGRIVSRRPRPWLGLYTAAERGAVFVEGFAASGPARTAGFRKGDRILGVNGVTVSSQEEFYEQLWRFEAGDVIQVQVRRDSGVHVIAVRSVDRRNLSAGPRP